MEHNTGSAPVVSLERQVESVERSIMFLRQEQLSLLHGLHLEILSLQKRCTELTQEINMKPPGRDEEAAEAEHHQLAGRWREAERLLEQQEEVQSELRWELSQKSVLVGALRASLKEKERRFLQELKERSHRTTALHHQLRRQTEAESHLAFQLHSAKQRRRQPGPAPQASAAAPPPAVKPKRRGPAHLRAERARECVPRERVTGPEEPMPMPDPALFLYAYRHRPRPQPPQRLGGAEPLEEAEPGLTTAKNSAE